METVMRHQLADYLDVGKDGTESYALMGVGFNTLDENPNAQRESKTYVSQKSQTTYIKSYQATFPFDTDLISSEEAIMKLYEIGRNQATGETAEVYYVRAELFRPVGETPNTFAARRFKVAVEVSGITGEGGSNVKVAGNLNGVGDFEEGTFNTQTKTFALAE